MSSDLPSAILAIVVIVGLILIMRWVFKPSRPRSGARPLDASDSPNLGLLSVIESGLTRQQALGRRATLQEAGIRSSMSKRRDGLLDVLVFHADADAARLLLNT